MELLRLTNWLIVKSWRALTLLVGVIGRVFLWVTSVVARRLARWHDGRPTRVKRE